MGDFVKQFLQELKCEVAGGIHGPVQVLWVTTLILTLNKYAGLAQFPRIRVTFLWKEEIVITKN